MTQWARLRKKIPNRVQVGNKAFYNIIWVDKFPSEGYIGITIFDNRQIMLSSKMPDKTAVITYLHELMHAFAAECDVTLTESQVLKLEDTLHYILKDNNLFRTRRRSNSEQK